MRNLKLFTLTLVAGILMVSFQKNNGTHTAPLELKIGDTAPLSELKMINIDNTEHTLKSLKKQGGLLVVFSCNTCPFVVGGESFPGWERQYNELHALAKKQGIQMVLVNSNEAKRGDDDSFEAMQAHAATQKYSMPYLVDKNSELANAFGAKTTPHVYLLDADLKLVYKGAIDNTWDPKRKEEIPYLKNALTNLSKKEAVKEATSAPKGCSIKRVSTEK